MIRDILAFLVLLMFSALVWFGGQALGWSDGLRLLIITILAGLYLIAWIVQKVLAIRRSMRIEKQLKAQAEQQVKNSSTGADGLKQMQSHFKNSLNMVKRSRLGRSALVDLPWYLFIGPPGAGKTTALQESGINLSVMGTGVRGVRGIGGTKNCDWWFTDQAIFLDTAGRYTVEVDDHDEWASFLTLLNKTRKSRAINGCILAISAKDLINYDPAQVELQAQVMRERLDELCQNLKVIFPVYVVISKCDLIPSFNDFFKNMEEKQRQQILGVTLPWTDDEGGTLSHNLRIGLDTVLTSLSDLRPSMLEMSSGESTREHVYAFPGEFEHIAEHAQGFVKTLFQDNHLHDTSRLRGVYFTSSVQEFIEPEELEEKQSLPLGPSQASSFAAPTASPDPAPVVESAPAPVAAASASSAPNIQMPGMQGVPGLSSTPISPAAAGPAPIGVSSTVKPMAPGVTTDDVFSDLDGADTPTPNLTPQEIATQALSVTQSISKRKSNRYRQGGMFLRSLFSKRIIGDKQLTRPLDRVIRRRGAMSKFVFNGSIVAAIVLSVWLGISYLGNRSMAMEGARLRADVVRVFTSESLSEEQAIIGLANLLPILKQIHGFELEGTPWHLRGLYNGTMTLSDALMTEYFNKIRQLVLQQTVSALAKNIEERRQQDGKTLTEYDELYDHYRVYLTLTGQSQDYLLTDEDHELNTYMVNRVLDKHQYWFVAVDQDKGLDDQSLLGAAMRNHFEFFMSQIDRPNYWSLEADMSLVERINFELSEALWVQQSYRDIISNASGMYEPVRPELLVSGSNANLLNFPFTFSSVFTQEVWSDYVQEAIQAKADSLVRKFKSLGIEKTADQVSDRLTRQFRNDYRRQWWRLSSQVRPVAFENLDDAIEKMRELTGDESPYVSLINSLKSRRELNTAGGIEPGLLFDSEEKEKEPWLEEGLNAIYAAQESLASFVKKTQIGKRTEDLEALNAVAGSLNDAYTALNDALKAIQEQSHQQLMKQVLSRILDNARIALSDEIGNEVNARWRNAVSEVWNLEMRDQFPFNKDAQKSVSLRRFAELFNPKSGVISQQLLIIKGIGDIEINGKSVVYESREFKRIKQNVALLQKTLFVEESEALNAPLAIRFNQRLGISAMSFSLGDQLVSLFDKQLPRYELTWKQDQEATARFTVHILEGIERKSWNEQAVEDPWCLIRVLRSGEQVGYNEQGGIVLRWPFQAMAAGRKLDYVAELAVEGAGWDEVLSLDFWLDIQLPDKVTR